MFYITTTIPYVNGEPHLGHLLEAIFNDTIARYKRRFPEQVLFSMGLDQHGLKIYRKAQEQNLKTEDFVREKSQFFLDLWKDLEISHDIFVQTSLKEHKVVSQIVWQKLQKKGLIYKKTYTGLYSVGDEAFVSEGQLRENGMCPNHDEYPIEMTEENYFFKLSSFSNQILDFIATADIRPKEIKKEWENFVKEGLEDISISREKKNLPWGVGVPGDENQVMYVWFEALINYLTALVESESIDKYLEFPYLNNEFEPEIWDQIKQKMPIDFIFMGKDVAKFHLIIWIGMLFGLGLPVTTTSLVHGFINDKDGRKMSKSLGNGISPQQLVSRFGKEGMRFVMLYETNIFGDTNFDWQRSVDSFNANLADNLGNLVMRVSNLIEKHLDGIINLDIDYSTTGDLIKSQEIDFKAVYTELENYNPQKAMQNLFAITSKVNQYFEQTKPWTLAKDWTKNEQQVTAILVESAKVLMETGKALSIFMPETGEKIYSVFNSPRIVKAPVLFQKIELD